MGKTDTEDVPGISLNDKHQKLFTRGREQHDLRPKVALLAAAIRADALLFSFIISDIP